MFSNDSGNSSNDAGPSAEGAGINAQDKHKTSDLVSYDMSNDAGTSPNDTGASIDDARISAQDADKTSGLVSYDISDSAGIGANTAGTTSAKDAKIDAQNAVKTSDLVSYAVPNDPRTSSNDARISMTDTDISAHAGVTSAGPSSKDPRNPEIRLQNEQSALRQKRADRTKHRAEQPPRKSPCDGQCGTRVSRNLVVSIDGTSNQFGSLNTNVVELHSRVLSDEDQNQLKYYNCGIGTYVPTQNKMSWKYLRQKIHNGLDLAFALNFKKMILKAYRWLSQVYKKGDKIFLFGFSRGAYQVRTLAGMIEMVGLIDAGNEELIPFAYEIYSERHKGVVTPKAEKMAQHFKKTYSRDVRIHFVGVWDTVSSVGVFRGKPLPLTSSSQHICTFRHALALDERRVKFLPEYVDRGSLTTPTNGVVNLPTDVKEVWFAGVHSDIGGGLRENIDLNLSSVSVLWMENEAAAAGLRLDPRTNGAAWNLDDLQNDSNVHESLTAAWKPLEYLPLTRLSFQKANETTRKPHLGAGRIITPGQRVHISVAFKNPPYSPRATFLQNPDFKWESFVGKELELDEKLTDQIEMDLFDASFIGEAVKKLKDIWTEADNTEEKLEAETYWIERLAFMALSGRLAANYLSKCLLMVETSPKNALKAVHDAVEAFQKLQGNKPGTFDADVAALLENEAHLLRTLEKKEEALHIYRKAEILRQKIATTGKGRSRDDENLANCLENISICCYELKLFNEAVGPMEDATELRRKILKGKEKVTGSTASAEFGHSLRNLSYTLSTVDRHEDALKTDKAAVKLYRKLLATEPNAMKDLGNALNDLGFDLRELRRYTEALSADKEAVTLHHKGAETDPAVRKDLVNSLVCLSIDHRQLGHHEDALRVVEETVEICRSLVQADLSARNTLASTLNSLGVDLRSVGRYKDALRADEEATELWHKLADTDPMVRKDLVWSLHYLSLDLRPLGRHEDALHTVEKIIKTLRRLVETDLTARNMLADSLNSLGADLYSLARYEDALRAGEEAIELWRQLTTTNGSAKELARSLSNLGIYFRALGCNEDALRVDKETVELRRKLAETDTTARKDLANSLVYLSIDFHQLGRNEDALRAVEESVKIPCRLAEGDLAARNMLAHSLNSLGIDLYSIGRYEDALHADEKATQLWRKLAETDPAVTKDLAESLNFLSWDQYQLSRLEDASRSQREAVELHRKVADTEPTAGKDLSASLFKLGIILRQLGQYQDALLADKETVELRRKLTEEDPALAERLANSLENLGLDFKAVGRLEDALGIIQEACEVYQQLPDRTTQSELSLANGQKLLAALLHAVDRQEDALRADAVGIKIYGKVVQTDPKSAAEYFHDLAIDFHSIGLHEDALRAEEQAADLCRMITQTNPSSALLRHHIKVLGLLSGILRTLGREEDAMLRDAEVTSLKDMLAKALRPISQLESRSLGLGEDMQKVSRKDAEAHSGLVSEQEAAVVNALEPATEPNTKALVFRKKMLMK
ncbi:DUF2235 domain-containing protein [Mycena venus]|uniref:DUF2235 domain-containing protein n=1 Tax=Mycena venus TaxID=2733690 RepID=A0A8H6YNX9_9AGAR|nr:DUF2235 domain-containing protein [Mycena venus]